MQFSFLIYEHTIPADNRSRVYQSNQLKQNGHNSYLCRLGSLTREKMKNYIKINMIAGAAIIVFSFFWRHVTKMMATGNRFHD